MSKAKGDAKPRRDHGSGQVFERPDREGYWVRLRKGTGKNARTLVRKGGRTKTEAKHVLRKLQKEIAKRPVEEMTFKRFAEGYFERAKLAPSTAETYELWTSKYLIPALGEKRVSRVAREDVVRLLDDLTDLKPATRNRVKATVSAILQNAVDRGNARSNPCRGIKNEREERRAVPGGFMDQDEQGRFMDAMPNVLRPFVQVAFGTGLRLGELCALEWSDVDLNRGTVTVRKSKGKRPRVVPIARTVHDLLADLREARTVPLDGPDRVFSDLPADSRSWRDHWACQWDRKVKRFGRGGFTRHDMRHVYGMTMASLGVPLSELQKLMGHRSIATTMRYVDHVPDSYIDRARGLLDAAPGGGARATEAAS